MFYKPESQPQKTYENNLFAISPAIRGKKNVLTIRMSVNFQPIMPTSIGNLPNAHSDHPVKNATVVPTLAPERKSPAAIGKLT